MKTNFCEAKVKRSVSELKNQVRGHARMLNSGRFETRVCVANAQTKNLPDKESVHLPDSDDMINFEILCMVKLAGRIQGYDG